MKKLILTSLILVLAACSQSGSPTLGSRTPVDVSHFPKTPFKGVKVGKPYKIMGKWYSPHHNPNYDEKGIASWYGPGFHGRKTANGERYDQYGVTAAHTTLPLPSIVRVTNLENGRAMNVRVNDRGPFHPGRIIDLSKAAADKLGVLKHGVAKVRVQYLEEETRRHIESKGNAKIAINYTEGFAPYHGMKEAQQAVIRQDLKSIPIEKVGQRDTAPIRSVQVSDLPDLTPQQVQSYEAPWIIQVASYADTVNAEKMMQRLLPMGQPLVQEVAVQGQSYYRVLLKPVNERSSRGEMLAALQQSFGIDDAKVISQ